MEPPTNTAEQLKMLRVQLLVRLIFRDTVIQYYTVLCMASTNVGLVGFFSISISVIFKKLDHFFQGEFLTKILNVCGKINIRVVKQKIFQFCMIHTSVKQKVDLKYFLRSMMHLHKHPN